MEEEDTGARETTDVVILLALVILLARSAHEFLLPSRGISIRVPSVGGIMPSDASCVVGQNAAVTEYQ